MEKNTSLKDRILNFILQYPFKTNKEIETKFKLSPYELKDIFRELKHLDFLNVVNEIEPYALFYIYNLTKIIGDYKLISRIINRTLVFPKIMELHLGRYCQLNCIFCQTKVNIKNNKYRNNSHDKSSLSKNEIFDIIDEFVLNGGEEIILSGGLEPFTSELTIPIIEYGGGEKNLNISIYTNGLSKAFKEESKLRIILKNTRKIRFSINAIKPETYHIIQAFHVPLIEANRLFNQAISAVRKSKNVKLRESYSNVQIGVSFLLIRENIDELIPALSFWEKTGIDFFDIRNDILNYEKNKFGHNLQSTIKTLLHNYKQNTLNNNLPMSWCRRYPDDEVYNIKSCYAPYKKVVLDLWGEFHACCLRSHIKNDKKTSFGYYLSKGDYIKIIQKNINKLPISPACEKCCDQEFIFNSCVQKIISDINNGYSLDDNPFREYKILRPYKKAVSHLVSKK